jgi:hypothetical protein
MNNNRLYPEATKEISEKRTSLAPEITEAFRNFSKTVLKKVRFQKKQNNLLPWPWRM